MPKISNFKATFDTGELSPRLLARVDLPIYNKAAKRIENAYPLIHGGVTKRRGTLFVGALKNESQRARLIPFEFSTSRRFMLVLNGGVIQFIKVGAFVETSPGVRYEFAIPYSAAELPDVQFAQSGNTMYLVHPNHFPRLLQRISDTVWTLTNIPFTYRAVSDVTFANAFISFKIINGSERFKSGDYFTITTTAGAISGTVGPVLVGGVGPPAANGQIAGVVSQPGSTTTETWTITCVLSTPGRQEWSVSGSVSGEAPAYWKTGSYPQTVAFFEQRLFFGGSPQFPQTIWASAAGDYLNLTVGNRDSDGIISTIASNEYSAITHMVSARSLLPLTTSTEFSFAGNNNSSLSGTSGNVIKDHTRHGSSNVKPLRIGREVIFLQREGRKARAISYSVTEDANVAPDITLYAEHLTRFATITDMAFSPDPDYIAWMVLSDGRITSLTLAREYDQIAWAQHSTDGHFENVGSVASASSTDTFLIVKRTIDGVERRFVELFDYEEENIVFMDCSAFYEGTPVTTISGLSNLEGKTVTIVADGVVHPSRVVLSGSITLEAPASIVAVGLPFTTTIELLNPEFGDASSSSQGRTVSITDVTLKFQDTVNCKLNGVDIPFRTNLIGLDTAVQPFTGDKQVKSLGWRSPQTDNPKNNIVTSDTPTPFTLLGVFVDAQVN